MSKHRDPYVTPRAFTETGALLKKFREEGKLSQRDVSEHLGYSAPQFISNFERGVQAPPTSKLMRLLKFLRISLEDYLAVYGKEDLERQRKEILAVKR